MPRYRLNFRRSLRKRARRDPTAMPMALASRLSVLINQLKISKKTRTRTKTVSNVPAAIIAVACTVAATAIVSIKAMTASSAKHATWKKYRPIAARALAQLLKKMMTRTFRTLISITTIPTAMTNRVRRKNLGPPFALLKAWKMSANHKLIMNANRRWIRAPALLP